MLKYEDLILIADIYQQTLKKFNYVDFVDLTLLTRKLYRNNPELIKFKALFVYEAEDLDAIMGDIIELILREVEDAVISINPDLGIYSFRGARPDYIMKKVKKNFRFNELEFEPALDKPEESILESRTGDEQADAVASHIAG